MSDLAIVFAEAAADDMDNQIEGSLKAAEEIASSDKFTSSYKTEEIRRVLDAGYDEIASDIEKHSPEISERVAKLEAWSRIPAPSGEDAVALQYTRERLAPLLTVPEDGPNVNDAFSKHLSNFQQLKQQLESIKAEWEIAIKAGDKVTARVFRDFGATPIAKLNQGPLPDWFAELDAQTVDMLSTPEQLVWRKQLGRYREVQQRMQKARVQADRRLRNSGYDGKGGITDGYMKSIANRYGLNNGLNKVNF